MEVNKRTSARVCQSDHSHYFKEKQEKTFYRTEIVTEIISVKREFAVSFGVFF